MGRVEQAILSLRDRLAQLREVAEGTALFGKNPKSGQFFVRPRFARGAQVSRHWPVQLAGLVGMFLLVLIYRFDHVGNSPTTFRVLQLVDR